MANEIPSISLLLNNAEKLYEKTFLNKADIAACAPGRVNLIGEHTDYNDGLVLPMALPLVTIIIGKKSEKASQCRIISESLDSDIVTFDVPSSSSILLPGEPVWANYIKGVVANFHDSSVGFDAAIVSSVPLGKGLSSSAALEVAMYTFLEALNKSKSSGEKSKALSCQKSEHDFAGVPCGIMDQYISVLGKKNFAILIDCRSLEAESIPLQDPDITFVLTDSNVRRELTGSEYPERRRSCVAAAQIMDKKSLRDATLSELKALEDRMDQCVFRRARHVISEIDRVRAGARCLRDKDYATFGKLMQESHLSLKSDFEVSCAELDELVAAALSVDGVLGSRMTGAGFGGCTVTLVKREAVNNLIEKLKTLFNRNLDMWICTPSDGARIVYMNDTE